MTGPIPDTAYSTWLAQMSDPKVWKTWLQTATQTAPITTTTQRLPNMEELGITFDPAALRSLQQNYMQQFSQLWGDTLVAKAPAVADKRFAAAAWQANPLFAFNAAAYLLNAQFLGALADAVQAPPKLKRKIRFAVQQMIDAASPANFLATNPEAQQKIIESKGESLSKGVAHLFADMQKGRISQTDETAFEVGKSVATSEGAVVFENDLFQLIQYKSLTSKVYQRPLLLVPPCINKFYIMDLQPDNSIVRYAVEQGHTVFLMSWRNPDASLGHLTWNDYIENGVILALHTVQEITGQKQINALGFCVGGTLLATGLSVLNGRKERPVASLTLLTTLLDFADAGILEVFIDEAQIHMREQAIGQGGLMPGRDFASAFSSLRPNDLIWNYVGSNYLKGEDPRAFDLLYWNADSTNLPGPMFCYYLRHLYLENALRQPGKLSVSGDKVDLRRIDVPTFIYGSRDDHIVPWQAAYQSTALLNPKKPNRNRFVLGASGHIAGVINPPSKNKRNYWCGGVQGPDAQNWLQSAEGRSGSWWPEWAEFLSEHGGAQVAAPRKYGNLGFRPIEPAPGRYVQVRAD